MVHLVDGIYTPGPGPGPGPGKHKNKMALVTVLSLCETSVEMCNTHVSVKHIY